MKETIAGRLDNTFVMVSPMMWFSLGGGEHRIMRCNLINNITYTFEKVAGFRLNYHLSTLQAFPHFGCVIVGKNK